MEHSDSQGVRHFPLGPRARILCLGLPAAGAMALLSSLPLGQADLLAF